MSKKAIITGCYGQDGSYLSEILSSYGYEIHGIEKMPLSEGARRLESELRSKGVVIKLHECDLNNYNETGALIDQIKPDECYHLATMHYSSSATEEERLNSARKLYETNIIMASNIIHAISAFSSQTRLVLAGSCLMYDNSAETPQTELTPFNSNSIYGLSKIAASELGSFYRRENGLHCSTSILFNHESPRRSLSFVTQKISTSVVKIKEGELDKLTLASLDIQKDWGYAKDYANAIYLMAQQEMPDDYILSTGKTHSIAEFAGLAFAEVGIENWMDYVEVDESVAHGTVTPLVGVPNKAYDKLNWKHSISFNELVRLMVRSAASKSLD